MPKTRSIMKLKTYEFFCVKELQNETQFRHACVGDYLSEPVELGYRTRNFERSRVSLNLSLLPKVSLPQPSCAHTHTLSFQELERFEEFSRSHA